MKLAEIKITPDDLVKAANQAYMDQYQIEKIVGDELGKIRQYPNLVFKKYFPTLEIILSNYISGIDVLEALEYSVDNDAGVFDRKAETKIIKMAKLFIRTHINQILAVRKHQIEMMEELNKKMNGTMRYSSDWARYTDYNFFLSQLKRSIEFFEKYEKNLT